MVLGRGMRRGRPPHDRLPASWLDRWERHLRTTLTKTLHDPPGDHSEYRRFAAEEQNRRTSMAVLERAVGFWE